MEPEQLRDFIVSKAEDLKARDICILDIREKSDVSDFLIVCSGNSKTHVRSIAEHIATESKHSGEVALGIEGETEGEWVLVDFGPVVAHVMQDAARDFYQLEKLWGHP